jgi:hypothetical protein
MRTSLLKTRVEWNFTKHYPSFVGRDSIVVIVTHYGLDGPGIKFRWG